MFDSFILLCALRVFAVNLKFVYLFTFWAPDLDIFFLLVAALRQDLAAKPTFQFFVRHSLVLLSAACFIEHTVCFSKSQLKILVT